jgi:peroxin-3
MGEDESFTRDDDEMAGGIDVQTERLYLTFSWWFLHEGWKELAEDVKEAVTDVFGSLALKTQLTHQDFLLLLNKVRRRVEYEVREDGADTPDARSEWSEGTATTARRRGKRKTFLSVLFPPTSQEIWTLEKAGAISTTDPGIRHISQLSPNLPTLLDETKDILESSDFSRILRLSLSRVFQVFEETLRPTFGVEPAMPTNEVDGLLRQSSAAAAAITGRSGSSSALSSNNGRFQQLTDDGQAGVRVRLASLFPAVARQSSTAINGVPNEYVEALTEIKELKAFSAVIYSSWS